MTEEDKILIDNLPEGMSLEEFHTKAGYHQAMMDYIFKDINPMVLGQNDPEEAQRLFSLVGQEMVKRFGT